MLNDSYLDYDICHSFQEFITPKDYIYTLDLGSRVVEVIAQGKEDAVHTIFPNPLSFKRDGDEFEFIVTDMETNEFLAKITSRKEVIK